MKTRLKTPAPPAARRVVRRSAGIQLMDVMSSNVEVVAPSETLEIAARKMKNRDIGFLPVCDGDRLIGALSDRDIAVRAVSAGYDPSSTPVEAFITPDVVWSFADEPVDRAAEKMARNNVRRLVVIDRSNRRLVGVLSIGDLAHYGGDGVSSKVLQSVAPTH